MQQALKVGVGKDAVRLVKASGKWTSLVDTELGVTVLAHKMLPDEKLHSHVLFLRTVFHEDRRWDPQFKIVESSAMAMEAVETAMPVQYRKLVEVREEMAQRCPELVTARILLQNESRDATQATRVTMAFAVTAA